VERFWGIYKKEVHTEKKYDRMKLTDLGGLYEREKHNNTKENPDCGAGNRPCGSTCGNSCGMALKRKYIRQQYGAG
jgi:hypothetical protein